MTQPSKKALEHIINYRRLDVTEQNDEHEPRTVVYRHKIH